MLEFYYFSKAGDSYGLHLVPFRFKQGVLNEGELLKKDLFFLEESI